MKKNNIKLLIPLLFVMGIIYVMPNILNKYRKGEAKGKVIYYTINNAPMAAAYVVRSGNRGRRSGGAVSHYAETINLQTGEVVWSTKLSGQKYDRPSTHLLMAQSKVYLFYFLDGLIVVDKATGKIVAETKDLEKENPAQKENFPSRLDKYYLNEPEQAILFTGNDALCYVLNTNTLKTTVTSNKEILRRQLHNTVYFDHATCGYDAANGKFTGILGEEDKEQLENGYYYGGRTDENARRYLYKSSYTGLNKTGRGFIMDSLIKINDEPFIYGTFLTSTPLPDNVVRENPPVLHLAHPDAYIMIHKTSLATDAKMLISIVQPNGKIIRTIKTPLQGISSYHLYNRHLALAGTQKSGNISDLLYIDLTNGSAKGFTFNNQETYEIR